MPLPVFPVQLIVGLGNPGSAYAKTRHNIGSELVEQFAKQQNITLSHHKKLYSRYGHFIATHGNTIHLSLPLTFMNLSGKAVAACSHFYHIAPENILVIHDELALAPTDNRLKFGGGHAGHNGLRDIIEKLNTPNFYRLRLGIGHPGDRHLVSDYVLSDFSKVEATAVKACFTPIFTLLPYLFNGQFIEAQQLLHRFQLTDHNGVS